MIGNVISHYKIVERLGGGGMGIVYKAEDLKLNRIVALKFLPPELSRDTESRKRFIHEAQAASALQHNNICTIHEIDETKDGQMYICMDHYAGETLKKKIEQGPLRIEDAIEITVQIANGLASAHEVKEIHRDIKPANIMITDKGDIKIVDFGLAKLIGQSRLTVDGATLGTIAYMPPEQVRGEEVDQQTDIWSLGVVLYEMITGELPFKGEHEQAILYSIINESPEPLAGIRTGVPMELERIVNKMLAKNPEERYKHIDDMLVDLTALKFIKIKDRKKVHPIGDVPRRRIKLIAYLGLLGIVTTLIAVAIYMLSNRKDSIESIAILPFENAADEAELDYLCEGIPNHIINSLSPISELKIISSASVRKYKGKQFDLKTVAEELNVHAVLVGRLLQREKILSITVELINAQDNRQLWGEQYNQEFTEIFNIQKNIAFEISSKLRLRLTSVQKNNIEKTYTNNSKAYQAYLKGFYHWNKFSVEGFLKSIEYFQQGVQIDPNYALAYAGLALAYTNLGSYHGEMRPGEAIQKAREALWKALALDDEISEIYTSLGFINLFYDWDWQEAERAFLRAIELNPNSALARQHYGVFLSIMGRSDEAIVELKHALELDPLTPKVYDDLALTYIDLNQYNQAIRLWNTVFELDPNFFSARRGLGTVYVLMGQHVKGVEEFRKAVELSNRHHRYLGYLGWALAMMGQRTQALEIIEELKDNPNYPETHAIDIAHVYLGLGDKEKSFYWLEKAYQSGSSAMILIKVEPYYDDLRSDPRFDDLLKKMRFEY